MSFSELRLSPPILRAVEQEGYSTPTPIQAQTIPHVLAGRDVLALAQTGTGKTAAFALPILHRLSSAAPDAASRGPRKPRCLVLAPTRELAAQIAESFAAYGKELVLEGAVVYGGVSQFHQVRSLRKGVDIVVATPGRLMDLMEQRAADLSAVEILVLDEADRMLDMGFIDPIRRIAAATSAGTRQTLMFSATMPKNLLHLAQSLQRDPVRVAVDHGPAAAPKIEQGVYMVDQSMKQSLLCQLLKDPAGAVGRVLVFTRTKHGADRLGKRLYHEGFTVGTIHGNKSQPQRRKALETFRAGGGPGHGATILVATDVAARGIDVDNITHVINYDLPVEPEAYVHRIGRTGRAGATGTAISFCGGDERVALRDIERLLGKRIELHATPTELVRTVAPRIPTHAAAPQHREPQRPRNGGGGSRGSGHRTGGPAPSGRPAAPAQPGRRTGKQRPWNGLNTGRRKRA